jgi:hypothetical protein
MNKRRALLFAIVALAFGLVAGGYATSKWYERYLYRFCADDAAAELGKDHSVLHHLRAGDTNSAIDLLEIDLDGQMIAVQGMLEEIPKAEQNTNDVVLLERARAYRKAHPTNGVALTHAHE